jgi:hypothetical protein
MVKVVKTKEKLPLIQKVTENWEDKQFCYLAVERNPEDFQRCKYQDEKLVKRAVFLEASNIEHVDDKFLTHTYALQLVKKHPDIVQYLPKRLHTRAIVYEALKKDPSLIFYLGTTENYQLKAVESDGLALKYCTNPSKKVIKAALKNNGEAIQFINKDSADYLDYCLLAVKSKGSALKFIDYSFKMGNDLCLTAIKQDPLALKFVPDEVKPEVEEKAQNLNAEAAIYALNPIYEAAKFACYVNRENILYFKKPIIDMILNEVNYKTESRLLKIKIFLRRLGIKIKR